MGLSGRLRCLYRWPSLGYQPSTFAVAPLPVQAYVEQRLSLAGVLPQLIKASLSALPCTRSC